MNNYQNYFSNRNISPESYINYELPAHLEKVIPENKEALILDFGCGFGQILQCLINKGYHNANGYDIEPDAINYCKDNGLPIIDGTKNELDKLTSKFDFIILNHVLEHFPKPEIIPMLVKIRNLLTADGEIYIAVPNAQSNTGAYWAYEDFTHHTLFTGGSLLYVLRQAGFSSIRFIDPDCLEQSSSHLKRFIRKILLRFYKWNFAFWNSITLSSFHLPSPQIFSYEIKVLAKF
ncbi:class I SAM-dependent methyltransferase [Methylomonas paludis]|uniref:Class I SAM-dependent methyltransferase n=1 Tax=Methylomonas paludis TaxID=1173101 RepID=A0A975R902_9GAMM|nr:class I SAM-dependent methyltransferase [Methylomonas paludis]QWF70940.1 class I SAM-dependent methyltransferase [Methylomonas paludis]